MASGFGTTLGVGATDRIATALTTHVATRTYCIRANRNGAGGGSAGHLFTQLASNTQRVIFFHNDGGAEYSFHRTFSTAAGSWSIVRPSSGVWVNYAIRFDDTSASNDPVIFQNSTKLSIGSGITETATPSGTPVAITGNALQIGNRPDGDRAWDGSLAEFAAYDVILTDEECLAFTAGYSPKLIRPASLAEYVPLVRDNVGLKLGAPTITGTAVQPHPRVIGFY